MKFKRCTATGCYHDEQGKYEIEPVGGFITCRHWWATRMSDGFQFWQPTKKEAIAAIEKMESTSWLPSGIYIKALY